MIYVYQVDKTTFVYKKSTKPTINRTTTIRIKVISKISSYYTNSNIIHSNNTCKKIDEVAVSGEVLIVIPVVILFIGIIGSLAMAYFSYGCRPVKSHLEFEQNTKVDTFNKMEVYEMQKKAQHIS